MSADNWADCPRCHRRHEREVEQLRKDANTAYGNVPQEQWQHLDALVSSAEAREPESTLREDYEIYGAEEGSVNVRYSGQCQVCGLSLTFEHEAVFDGVDE